MSDYKQEKWFTDFYLYDYKRKDDVLEGYMCILTPILSERPVRFFDCFSFQHIEDSPILDKFIDTDDKRFFNISDRIWLHKEHAYIKYTFLRNCYWEGGNNNKSWSVIKVLMDKELIREMYSTEYLIKGCSWPKGPWPLYVICPTVYCAEFVYHGIASRPDITEDEGQIEIWNNRKIEDESSYKLKYSKNN